MSRVALGIAGYSELQIRLEVVRVAAFVDAFWHCLIKPQAIQLGYRTLLAKSQQGATEYHSATAVVALLCARHRLAVFLFGGGYEMISPEVLRRFPLFAGLAPIALTDLAKLCRVVILEEGQWLFYEDDAADALYLIITGCVSLNFALGDKQASYTTLSQRYQGDVLGWSALVKPHFYKFGALATEDTQLVRIEGQGLLAFMKENPDYGYPVMQALTEIAAQRLMSFRTKLEYLEERQFLMAKSTDLGQSYVQSVLQAERVMVSSDLD